VNKGPALVSILRQGRYLIASVHIALNDDQMVRFQGDLIDRIGTDQSAGIIIDVAALDVLDSSGREPYATSQRWLACVEQSRRVVGIQPDVAFAMVEPGLHTSAAHTALDLEEGLRCLPS